jgi:succinoglycan biosynthesis protein ExoA
VRRYRGRNPWRFFVPPLLVVSVLLSVIVGVLQLAGVLTGVLSAIASLVYLGPIAYVLLMLWVAFVSERGPTLRDSLLYLVVLPTMHLSWGVGFLGGLLRGARDVTDTSRTDV